MFSARHILFVVDESHLSRIKQYNMSREHESYRHRHRHTQSSLNRRSNNGTCVLTAECRVEKQWSRLAAVWSRSTDRLSVRLNRSRRSAHSSDGTASSPPTPPDDNWLTVSSAVSDIVSTMHLTRLTTFMYSNGKYSNTSQQRQQGNCTEQILPPMHSPQCVLAGD